MKLNKWNYQLRSYEDYEVPDDWYLPLLSDDMEEKINCAKCGAFIKFGDSYTSSEIHTAMGFGYYVCEKCHEEEWKHRILFERGLEK